MVLGYNLSLSFWIYVACRSSIRLFNAALIRLEQPIRIDIAMIGLLALAAMDNARQPGRRVARDLRNARRIFMQDGRHRLG
jgi:hypothetical protein